MKKEKKPFIPKDMPKSAVVMIAAGLIALLLAGPFIFIGIFLEIIILLNVGKILFTVCVFLFFFMFVIFNVNHAKGKHQLIRERSWKNQVW